MELYLSECLDSLLGQQLEVSEYEIIVINDGSKDSTLEIATNYAANHTNIVVIDKKNAGVGAARNSGFDIARGEYIYFLDPDDYLAEKTIPVLLKIAHKNNLDILTFESKSVVKRKFPLSKNLSGIPNEIEIFDGITYLAKNKHKNEIWWYLIRRDFMIDTGVRFIEGIWMEDAIFTAELFCVANSMAHVSLDVHRYRILPTSAMRNKSPEHYNKVIRDNAKAAHIFDRLIKNVPMIHRSAGACIKRLKTRQQSFVFFLMVRLMKSDISIKEIPGMLKNFKKIGAYPLDKFIGEDYNGIGYSVLVFIFNRKSLINPFIKLFRSFYTLAR